MYKIIFFVCFAIACVCANPKPDIIAPVAYSAPVVAAPVATSSQYFARSTSPYVAYPYVAAYSAPYVAAAPYSAYTSTVLL